MAKLTPAKTPTDFLTSAIETWTVADLLDAIGTARVAELFELAPGTIRVLRHRGALNMERLHLLHDEILSDELRYRRALVAIRAGIAYHGPRHT